MNSQNTTAIKKLLSDASGGTAGPGDRGWQSEGVERLFFDEFGADGFRAGCVEVRHGESARNAESVRLELELAPALAARVIALVTNTPLCEMPDLTEPEESAIEECVARSADDVGAYFVGESTLSEADRRNKEIAELIFSQRRDKEREKELALEEKEKAQVEVEELDFDLPEAPL